MTAVGIAGHFLLGLSFVESFLLGAVLGAVSPAVVVPRTTKMLDEGIGTKHGIPQMITTGSSMDDIVMIVFYTSFLSVEGGGNVSAKAFINIPISIITGIAVGIIAGLIFSYVFKRFHLRDSLKLSYVFGTCFGFVWLETVASEYIGYSGLLSVIAMGIVILSKRREQAVRLKQKCDRLWVVSEMFLFTLVGASIQIEYALKATVQAAIGGGLLDLGYHLNDPAIISAGTTVLSVAVVAILFTAPLGAYLMDFTRDKLFGEKE